MAISHDQLLRLAKPGAVARVRELQAELDTIFKTFPDLRSGTTRVKSTAAPATKKAPKRAWSATDRKAVSERMKKYWAARRAKASKKA